MSTPPIPDAAPKGDRIAKLLARAGIASRREVERMIDERRIALDGAPLETPATILTSLDGVTVDGKPVAAPEAARLFVYHKPPGLLVTERDPAGRATIYDRLPADLPRTVPVGRLDLSTEGLLLLTTDGGLKRTLELPATGVERTYRARAYGNVTQAMLEELIEGVEIEGIRYGPIDANLERRTGANVWIELTLTEGKNREVRRVLEHLGLEVSRLIRTRYGPFILGDLPPGEVGEVGTRDLTNFTRSLGSTRRAKGADLTSLVTVEPRARASAPAAVRPEPRQSFNPPRNGEGDRPAKPNGGGEAATNAPRAVRTPPPRAAAGWGSRTRPSRPSEPEAPPRRGAFRLADEGRGRPARQGEDERRGSTDAAARGPSRSRAGRPAMDGERPRTHNRHPGEGRSPDAPPSRSGRPPSPDMARTRPRSDDRTSPGVRQDDVRGGRSGRTRPRGEERTDSGPRLDDTRGATSGRSAASAARPSRAASAPASRPRADKPSRTAGDPRSARNAEGAARQDGARPAPAKSGKGPAGGRGHPPRPPKGKPRGKR